MLCLPDDQLPLDRSGLLELFLEGNPQSNCRINTTDLHVWDHFGKGKSPHLAAEEIADM